jgi:YbbR domain-containing protein
MQIRLLKFIRQTKASKGLRLNKQFSVFVICFLIACVFWLLISLNRNYSSTISFPIVYTDLPKDKVLVNDLPEHVVLELNARGFDLIGYHFKLLTFPVLVKIDAYTYGNRLDNYLVTRPLINSLTRQLHSDGRVIAIEPDTIFLKYNKRLNKKVPVLPNLQVYFQKQYNFAGKIQVQPDSVLISGPDAYVDSVKSLSTNKLVLRNLKSGFSQNVLLNLQGLNKHITVLHKNIVVKAPVEKFTEATIEIPVSVKSNASEYRIKTIPDKVKLSFLVSLTQYSKVSPQSFTAVADFVTAAPTGLKIKVDLVKQPAFVKVLKVWPSKVEFVKIK